MTIQEKAHCMLEETLDLLRNKPINSTLTEHWFLLDAAWKEVEGLPQPIQFGKGLSYILEHASLPIKEHDLLLGRFIDKVPNDEEEAEFQRIMQSNPTANPIVRMNYSHITLDWYNITERGITGYIALAENKLKEAESSGADDKEIAYLRGMLYAYRACRRYIERYGIAARECGMNDLADVCEILTAGAPTTFRSALQLILFILNIDYIYAGNVVMTLTCGRMDDILFPFYETDIKSGILTREEAGYLIDDFNCKASLILGRGEHQMSNDYGTGWWRNSVYDSPTYVIIGGYSTHCDYRKNSLTKLFIEHIHPRLENPVYIFRRTKNDDDELWHLLCDKLRQNASVIIYNDETMIPAMENAGISHEDAINYTIHACNWPDAPSYAVTDTIGGSIAYMIMNALLDNGKLRKNFTSIDELYSEIGSRFREDIRPHFKRYRERYRSGVKQNPTENICITDCFTEGCLENVRGMYDGGVRYPAIYTLLRHIGTTADIMASLDKNVYAEHNCTLEEMAAAIADNFEKEIPLRTMCLKAPKYGTDSDAADYHAKRLLNMLLDIIDEETLNENGIRDVISFNVTITDMNHIVDGANLCATPDGRFCGAPLSENLSPTVGHTESITALLNSVSKLPFNRIHSGAFNMRLRRDLVSGDDGLERLAVLTDVYFSNGGMQLQVSVADTAELREAQKHPENYKDLMVRITGYSAVFVDMSPNAQEEIIRRDEIAE